MPLNLDQAFEAPLVLGLIDTVTNLPVSATFGTPSYTSDTPAVAAIDAANNLEGLTPGTFNVIVSVPVTYQDSKGNTQNPTLTGTFPGSVALVAADSVALVLTLGTPVPIPAAS